MTRLELVALWLIAGDVAASASAGDGAGDGAGAGDDVGDGAGADGDALFTPEVCSKIVCILVQQAMEKIDRYEQP
jgi:hypothetical protein